MGAQNASKAKRVVGAVLSITCFLLLWQWGTSGTKLGLLMPTPIQVAERFLRSFVDPIGKHSILGHVMFSLSRVIIGYSAAAFCGIALGILMGRYRVVEAIFMPLYEMIRPIPPIAWIPLAILWFGLGEMTKWFLIFLSTFNTITLNVYSGAKSVDPVLLGASKMLGANPLQTMYTIVMPYTVPFIFAGLHTAISVSWATVVAAEMVRSTEGVGWIIINAMEINNMVQVLTGIVAIGMVGYLLAIIMRKVEDVMCRWNKGGK